MDRGAAEALVADLLRVQAIDPDTFDTAQRELVDGIVGDLVAGRPVAVPVSLAGWFGYYAAAPTVPALNAFRSVVAAFCGATYARVEAVDHTAADAVADLLRAAGYSHLFRVERGPGVSPVALRAKFQQLARVRAQAPPRERAGKRSIGAVLREFEWAAADRDVARLDDLLRQAALSGEVSEDNMRFLTVRRHAAVGDWDALWADDLAGYLLRVPRPAAVTDAMLTAVWERELAPVGDDPDALAAAFDGVRERYGPLFTSLAAAATTPARRVAMLFAVTHDPVRTEDVRQLLTGDDDPLLHALAALATRAAPPAPASPLDAAHAAMADAEWDVALRLLRDVPPGPETAALVLRAAFEVPGTEAAVDALNALAALSPEDVATLRAEPAIARRIEWAEQTAHAVLAVAAAAPGSWPEWLDVVERDPWWAAAAETAYSGASTWPLDLVDDRAAAAAFAERVLAAADDVTRVLVTCAPYLDQYLDRAPHAVGAADISRALFSLLVLADAASAADVAVGAKLVDRVLEAGPDAASYAQVLADVVALWERLSSYEHLDWALAVVDAVARCACPDAGARDAFLTAVSAVAHTHAGRLLPGERRYLHELFEECGVAALLPPDVVDEEPERPGAPSPWQQLQGHTVGLHCLFEPIVKRFRAVIPVLCPGADVATDSSHDCSSALRALCESADPLVVVTQHAKHAATECIDTHARPEAIVRTRGARVGFTGVYRALEEHLAARLAASPS